MDRRNFLRLVPTVITAVVVAPKLLVSEVLVKPSIWGPNVDLKLKNQISSIRNNYIIGCDPATGNSMNVIVCKSRRRGYTWVQQAEWQFAKDWQKQQEQLFNLYNFNSNKSFFQMKP